MILHGDRGTCVQMTCLGVTLENTPAKNETHDLQKNGNGAINIMPQSYKNTVRKIQQSQIISNSVLKSKLLVYRQNYNNPLRLLMSSTK